MRIISRIRDQSNQVSVCYVYGPWVDRDLGGGWTGDTCPTTTIGGAGGVSDYVCAAVAGHN
jgi:hypothetical protein